MDPTTQNILRECADRLIQTADLIARSPQQRLRPQLVQLLLQSPLPPRQQHPLFSQTRLRLLYQQPGRNMPVCSAINRQQETRAVDLIMEEGRREPIVRICRTTEDRRGQEPLSAWGGIINLFILNYTCQLFLSQKCMRLLSPHYQDFRKCSSDFQRIPMIFWRLPNIYEKCSRCSNDLWTLAKLFEASLFWTLNISYDLIIY